ncbi:MAG: hypothetical protein IPI78_12360 [Chitinophagaceae bacterium]|nr:hypothetical protein [Chitinophagaceae bacterium]
MAPIILTASAIGIKKKKKLLEAYGYSLADDLKKKFEFVYKEETFFKSIGYKD